MDKKVLKNLLFPRNLLKFFHRTCKGKFVLVLFSFTFRIGSFLLFLFELQRKQFVGKIFKVTKLRYFGKCDTVDISVMYGIMAVISHQTSSRCLHNVLVKTNKFALVIHLQKTSSRHLQDVLPRCLEDVFKTSSRPLAKLSSRHFQDVSLS